MTTSGEAGALPDLAARVRVVRQRVAAAAERAGRAPEDVTIIAVSKTVDPERVRVAYELGLKTFGENRVQEARSKIATLAGVDSPFFFTLLATPVGTHD